MKKFINICDRCKAEEIVDLERNSKYKPIQLTIGGRGCSIQSSNISRDPRTHLLLCEECQKKLGIYTPEDIVKTMKKEPELIDRLIELFSDLLDETGVVR